MSRWVTKTLVGLIPDYTEVITEHIRLEAQHRFGGMEEDRTTYILWLRGTVEHKKTNTADEPHRKDFFKVNS